MLQRLLMACVATVLTATAAAAGPTLEDLDNFPKSTLEIRAHDVRHRFHIWIADTGARAEQGLMFVRSLAHDQGMLFPQDPPRVIRMWMRNTLVPLDMLFIAADGRIVYIRENATPQSDDIITTPQPVKAVLELAGGEAARRQIVVGDRVVHASFTRSTDRPPH